MIVYSKCKVLESCDLSLARMFLRQQGDVLFISVLGL